MPGADRRAARPRRFACASGSASLAARCAIRACAPLRPFGTPRQPVDDIRRRQHLADHRLAGRPQQQQPQHGLTRNLPARTQTPRRRAREVHRHPERWLRACRLFGGRMLSFRATQVREPGFHDACREMKAGPGVRTALPNRGILMVYGCDDRLVDPRRPHARPLAAERHTRARHGRVAGGGALSLSSPTECGCALFRSDGVAHSRKRPGQRL
jgi:hypothetical protein